MTTEKKSLRTRIKPAHVRKESIKPTVKAAIEAGDIQGVIDNLRFRQRRFVEEYLLDFDAGSACQRAGYNCKNRANFTKLGQEMLLHPGIRVAIDQLTAQRSKEVTLKPEYVLNKIRRTVEKAENEGNHTAVLRGCELLARSLGMFIDKREISGPNGDAIRIQQEQIEKDAEHIATLIKELAEKQKQTIFIGEPEQNG